MTNPGLAQTFRTLAAKGKDGLYKGVIADAIVEAVRDRGGFLSYSELAYHSDMGSAQTEPVRVQFNGMVDV
jgi:gamma-glutamyltranspeptidase/glutathione hydrolase